MADKHVTDDMNRLARKFERNASEFRFAAQHISARFGLEAEFSCVRDELDAMEQIEVPALGVIVQRFQERDELLSWALENIEDGIVEDPTDEDKATVMAIVKLILLQARDAELAASYTPEGGLH